MRDFRRSSVARVWVPVLAAAAGMASLDRGTDPGDLVYFVHRGEQLLSGGWASTFADPMLQSGPLQLVLFGAVRNLAAFALAGRMRMFEHEWRVTSGTLLGLVLAPGTHFGWPLRLLQASLAVGAGAVVATTMRRSLHAVWLVPLTVVVLRVLLDPVSFGWYWLEAEALALVGAALVLRELPSRFPAARLGPAAGTRRRAAAPPPVRS